MLLIAAESLQHRRGALSSSSSSFGPYGPLRADETDGNVMQGTVISSAAAGMVEVEAAAGSCRQLLQKLRGRSESGSFEGLVGSLRK